MLTDKPQVGDTIFMMEHGTYKIKEDRLIYKIKEARLISRGIDMVCVGLPYLVHGTMSQVMNYNIAFVFRDELYDSFMEAINAAEEKERG